MESTLRLVAGVLRKELLRLLERREERLERMRIHFVVETATEADGHDETPENLRNPM